MEIKYICPTCKNEFIYKYSLLRFNKVPLHYCSVKCKNTTHGMSTRDGRKNKTNIKYDMWIMAKKRCLKSNKEFNIKPEDIPEIPLFCPILNIELIRNINNFGPSDNSPSLDRIDTSKGYIIGNLKIISNRANRIKSDSTLEEIKNIYNYMLKNNNKNNETI